jgi:3-methyladenine DNA glycosylase AlkD
VSARAEAIDAGLRAAAVPGRAEQEKRYLKSDLTHYGTPMPAIRSVVKRNLQDGTALTHRDLVALVEALWPVPVHERRVAAVELLEAEVGRLDAADLPLVERLVREARTWALVDPLAASIAGVIVLAHPDAAATLDAWVSDGDFWVRRAGLLALLPGIRRGLPDLDRLGRYADLLLDEREFFIRKAIGWVLRETGAREPAWVVAFLLPRLDRTAGLTVREAVKRLPDDDRQRVLAARSALA